MENEIKMNLSLSRPLMTYWYIEYAKKLCSDICSCTCLIYATGLTPTKNPTITVYYIGKLPLDKITDNVGGFDVKYRKIEKLAYD